MTRVHFVGIAGIGMSAVARVMLDRGMAVSGSDSGEFPVLAELRSLGADVHASYAAEHVGGATTVVVSTATKRDNPELLAALAAGVEVLHRATALAQLLVGHRAIAVAGTHGKTTTTAMLTVALQHAGADPSYAVGGQPTSGAPNGHHGSGELFVLEADESDGSFLGYQPFAAIVTNIEADHLDHHGSVEAYEQVFRDFALSVSGFLVCCFDDPGARSLAGFANEAGITVITYGTTEGADLLITDLATVGGGTHYLATWRGVALGPVSLQVAGEHQARNSAAALVTAIELAIPAAQAIAGLAAFTTVRRRMELKGTAAGVRVYDDYAHHPTEIRVQLQAARQMAAGGRVIALFQPHLYSRTVMFAEAFGAALSLADEIVVLDIYGAREDPQPGVTGALVVAALPSERAVFEPDREAATSRVAAQARSGDLIVTLGAGDVTDLGPVILGLLEQR